MTGFNPNEFLSHINGNNGLAKPAKFEVNIDLPIPIVQITNQYGPDISRGLSLQCEAAELPGKNFVTEDVKIYGPTFKVPFQTQYNDISLTFLCSGNFYERFLFDSWMNLIMPTDTNNLRFPKGNDGVFDTGYLTSVLIKQYDDVGNEIYNVKLIDAFPINVQAQTLNWSEDGFHRLTVVFSYLRYETERKPIKEGQTYTQTEIVRPTSGENYISDDTFNVEPERAGGYVATDYLGGHDGGDNNQGQKAGQPYAGGGVLSGLVRALALGVVANAIAGARSNRGGDRPPPVGRNYAGSEPTTPPGGKPYGS